MFMREFFRKLSISSYLSLFFILIPIIIWALWIYVFNEYPNLSQSDKSDKYNSYFPQFIQNHLASIVLCTSLISIIFALIAIRKISSPSHKVPSMLIFIVGGSIILLQLFSMM